MSSQVSHKKPYSKRGADKSLAQPTLLLRMTESIVSLETVFFQIVVFKVFLATETEKNHVMRRTNSANRDVSCYNVFLPAKEDAQGNSLHSNKNIIGTFPKVFHCQKLGGHLYTW